MALGGLSAGAAAPRAVLFDAMGTLLRLRAPGPFLQRGLREAHGVQVSLDDAERGARAEMSFYRAHHDEGFDPDSLARLRLRCAEALRDALPAAAARVTPAALLPTLMDALRFDVFPDVVPALTALRAAGVRLAVVSNWDASLPDVLQRLGLADHVDAVVASASVGAAKPSPVIFDAALRAVGVAAADALHVGDTVEHDVLGARAAGIAAVLVRREGARPGDLPAGVRVVRSLAEVAALVA